MIYISKINNMTEETTNSSIKKKKNKMMYIFIGVFAIAVIALGVVYYQKNIGSKGKQQIIEKAFNYIGKNLAPNTKIELGAIDKDTKSFYRFIVKTESGEVPTYVSTDGKTITFRETDITVDPNAASSETTPTTTKNEVDGGFIVTENQICSENGKPIVYFFGSESCPHCQWEKPIIEEVVKGYGDKISFHENIDSEKDKDVFSKFNSEGGIPTIIIGCKYYRIGSGEGAGSDSEKESLKKVIDMVLTK